MKSTTSRSEEHLFPPIRSAFLRYTPVHSCQATTLRVPSPHSSTLLPGDSSPREPPPLDCSPRHPLHGFLFGTSRHHTIFHFLTHPSEAVSPSHLRCWPATPSPLYFSLRLFPLTYFSPLFTHLLVFSPLPFKFTHFYSASFHSIPLAVSHYAPVQFTPHRYTSLPHTYYILSPSVLLYVTPLVSAAGCSVPL